MSQHRVVLYLHTCRGGQHSYTHLLFLFLPLFAQVELGGRVVFYQQFYSTASVLCSHEVAVRVDKKLAVKPLEPITRSDTDPSLVKIYSLLGVVQGRNTEQTESLALFNTAYQLFAQRKFLEAEKAFCHHTKVYGYDNVVERLQKLIAQGKSIDDLHMHEVTHLD